MTVSSDDVRAVARLARLDLTDEEIERFRRELSTILEYVEQLGALEAGRAAEAAAPDHPPRGDVVDAWEDLRALHAAAPDWIDGYFRVPRAVE